MVIRICMRTLKNHCENCESTYKIVYDEELMADSPKFCPVCSEYILEDSENADDVDL